jgi:hypothetical protein
VIWRNAEASTAHVLTEEERQALVEHDFVTLFEMGAHFFLNLTLFIGIYDEPYRQKLGPLAFQREFAEKLRRWHGKTYPSIRT